MYASPESPSPANRSPRKAGCGNPAAALAFLLATGFIVGPLHASDETTYLNPVDHEMSDSNGPVGFNANGGWCWFQDERALVNNGKLLFGSVSSNLAGTDRGDIVATTYDFETKEIATHILHPGLQRDDHNAPAFLLRPDGRYLAVYTGHNLDPWVRYRISSAPGRTDEWGVEHAVHTGGNISYSNVYRLDAEGRTYNFYRDGNRTPSYLVSDDDGATWSPGGQFLAADDPAYWPYVRYASNGTDAVHFITTDAHPNQFASNSLYHGFIKGNKIHRSDGTVVGELGVTAKSSVKPSDLTPIFTGDPDNIPWSSDIRIDADGNPYIAYSVTVDGGKGFDNRYRYARWDGAKWIDHEIAFAGSMLYSIQNFYTGLIALDPDTPNKVFISTDADPMTGAPLISDADGERHHEIFVGATEARGSEWEWTPLTRNSDRDNIRPIIASDGADRAVLWMRGSYETYKNYDCEIVGFVSRTKGTNVPGR